MDTHERLLNWARWARSGRGGAATCYSAEGRYRPEMLRGDTEADRRKPAPAIDVKDALDVYRAIGPAHGFPARWYLAISARYIFGLSGWQFAGYMRRHGYAVSRLDAEHDRILRDAISAATAAMSRREPLYAEA